MDSNPYAAGTTSTNDSSSSEGLQPLKPLADAVTWLLLANALGMIGIDVADMYFVAFAPEMLDLESGGEPTAGETIVLLVQFASSIITLLALLVAIPFWTRWHSRAARNLEVLGQPTGYEPFWHAAYWFVPFANLYLPLRTMRRVYAASLPGNEELVGGELDSPPTKPNVGFGAWWAIHLAGGMIGWVSFRLSLEDFSGTAPIYIGWVATPLLVADTLLYLWYMRSITRMQEARAAL